MRLSKLTLRRTITSVIWLLALLASVPRVTAQTGNSLRLRSFNYQKEIRSTGQIRPFRNLTVKSKLSETVDTIPIAEGHTARKGQVILQFDTRTHRIRLNRTRHRMERARHQRNIARKTFERKKSLLERDLISESEYDQAELEYKQARENYAIARSDYNDARRQFDYTSVEAPFAGIVDQHLVEIGEQVRRGQPLLKLITLNPLKVEFEVTPEERKHLTEGDTIFVKLAGGTLPARLTRLSHDVSRENGLYPVTARLPNPDRRLIAGRTVTLSVPLYTIENAVKIPLDYVDRSSDRAGIVLRDPETGTLHQRTLNSIDYADDHVVTRRDWPQSWRLVPGSVYTKEGS